MNGKRVQTALARGLDDATVAALGDCAEAHDRSYRLQRWLVNQHGHPPVAVVCEDHHRARKTERVVLRVVELGDEPVSWAGFTCHRNALSEAPPEFAARHLVNMRDVWRVDARRWVVFQELAGHANLEALSALLCHMLGEPIGSPVAAGTPKPTAAEFARTCGRLISTSLHEWTQEPYAPIAISVQDVLGMHLHEQLSGERSLLPWAKRYPGRTIRLPDEAALLPNPFALAQGRYFREDPGVHLISGRVHGDLRGDNALVAARPVTDGTMFSLIGLTRYRSDGPVTRDPVHLLLDVLARGLHTLHDVREQLLALLLDPSNAHAPTRLPPWATDLVRTLDDTCRTWAGRGKLEEDWHQQSLLSLAGCSMQSLCSSSTRDVDKPWFLRVAARAAGEFVANYATAGTAEPFATTNAQLGVVTPVLATMRNIWRPLRAVIPAVWNARQDQNRRTPPADDLV